MKREHLSQKGDSKVIFSTPSIMIFAFDQFQNSLNIDVAHDWCPTVQKHIFSHHQKSHKKHKIPI